MTHTLKTPPIYKISRKSVLFKKSNKIVTYEYNINPNEYQKERACNK